jgi:hypothetical protein
MKSVVDQELFPKSHAHQFGFRFARKSPSTRSQFIRVAPCSTRSRGRLTKTLDPRKFHDPTKKQLVQTVGKGAPLSQHNARGIAECYLVSHVGNQRAAKQYSSGGRTWAFVSDQTGLAELLECRCGRRCVRLFAKYGTYACRRCHRAVWLSQTKDRPGRKRLTACKLRLALGGPHTVDEASPQKAQVEAPQTPSQ